MIEIISAKVGLENVYLKTELSLEEIKKKHPERTDLIESMEKALKDLAEAKYMLHRLDLKNMSLSSELYRNNRMLLEMMTEIKELKEINKKLIDNAKM